SAEELLASAHPRLVAAVRVDLPIVAEDPKGLRQLPGGERVRREALVHHRQGADELRVLQIPKEAGQLTGQEQPFVDDGPGRQARNVEAIFLAQVTFADRPLRPLADDEQLPFEDRLLFAGGADEHLSDVGGRLSGQWAGGRLIDRHLAPAEQTLTGAEDLVFEDLPAPVPFQSIPRQEHEAYGVLPHRRQLDAELHTLP